MEKEVVVAADVDEEEELSKVFKFVNLLWLHGLIDGESLEAARKISSQYQGYHEHEVSVGGEADLLRHYTRCQKNPGHSHFIPFRDFKIEHLPPGHRDKLIFDCIRAEADTTCRMLIKYTSANRPKYHRIRTHSLYPFSQVKNRNFMRVGTGRLGNVHKYTTLCICDECTRPGTHTPKKVWGMVEINTARHVVFDDDEAKHTTCYFGYDTSTTLLRQCLKLTGLRMAPLIMREVQIEGDWCPLLYVTHDMDIINTFYKMWCLRGDLINNLSVKYPCDEKLYFKDPKPEHVIIISHPHGFSKQISVGMWTHRETDVEKYIRKRWGEENVCVDTKYTYNAPTCPGSSGAPIIRLVGKGGWWVAARHSHSEGEKDNNNNNSSTFQGEPVSMLN